MSETRKGSKRRFLTGLAALGVLVVLSASLLHPAIRSRLLPRAEQPKLPVPGGSIITDFSVVRLRAPEAPSPWDQPIPIRRTVYEVKRDDQRVQYVQYQLFSLNGRPEYDKLLVRQKLALPSVRQFYVAKIELAPLAPVTDLAEPDRSAEEFLASILPVILRALPSQADIERLDRAW